MAYPTSRTARTRLIVRRLRHCLAAGDREVGLRGAGPPGAQRGLGGAFAGHPGASRERGARAERARSWRGACTER